MNKKLVSISLGAGLIVGSAAGLIAVPAVSGAQSTSRTTASAPANRPDPSVRLNETLKPLVDAGTITQAQADAVIAALKADMPERGERGRGGKGANGGAATIRVYVVNGKANIVGAVACGYVYVEGSTVGEVSESLLKDRRVLGEDGFLSIVAAIDFAERKVIAGPQIHARGFSKEESVFEEILPKIKLTLEAALADGVTDTHQLGQMVRRVAGKWVGEKHRRRPMIVPLIISN